MKFFINITNFIVDNLSNNANINYGPTYQNSHTANSTIIGSNINIGDNGTIVSKIINKGNQTLLPKESDSEQN
ncbi:spore germination protein [Neobacillus cucumis]|uniref:spore germination protein n=1 Tax=Neobacillus cucumis TaxID=1740721 RepID=UPI00203EA3DA|nr:spore germination protein [Neobacillus cucumis]MCM3729624.1 spore germination protein [Neobacillus cucumis]